MPVTTRQRHIVRKIEQAILKDLESRGNQRRDRGAAVDTQVTKVECDGVNAGFWITTEIDRHARVRGSSTQIFVPFSAIPLMVQAIAVHATPDEVLAHE